tara:strand:+ start:142 stop:432 length:291 start_codon:yes stop_codon:yes gene_type:complete
MKALLFLVSLLTTSSPAMSQEVATASVNPLPSVKEASSGESFPLQWTASKDIKNPVLGKVFFDIYLGTDPIARIGRESFLDALGDFLKPAQKSHER